MELCGAPAVRELLFRCRGYLASYPGLPSQLFLQPWKKAWVRPGSKHHVMPATVDVRCNVRNEVTSKEVHVMICNNLE